MSYFLFLFVCSFVLLFVCSFVRLCVYICVGGVGSGAGKAAKRSYTEESCLLLA